MFGALPSAHRFASPPPVLSLARLISLYALSGYPHCTNVLPKIPERRKELTPISSFVRAPMRRAENARLASIRRRAAAAQPCALDLHARLSIARDSAVC